MSSPKTDTAIATTVEQLGFTPVPYYCEENVWQLAAAPQLSGTERFAVFISNALRQCPVWSQRASQRPDGLVLWDYHVVLWVKPPGEAAQVWDVDCTQGCPLPAEVWLRAAFPAPIPPRFHPRFRVVGADELRRGFASDRSHMRLPNGEWQAPPPPWPPIQGQDGAHTLATFIDVTDPTYGELLDLQAFSERLIS